MRSLRGTAANRIWRKRRSRKLAARLKELLAAVGKGPADLTGEPKSANPHSSSCRQTLCLNAFSSSDAGYIGSHCVRQLIAAGHRPVVLDNLVYGHRDAVGPTVKLYDGNLGDEALVRHVLRDEKIEIVMHFAAFCYVGESVTKPLKYYFNNARLRARRRPQPRAHRGIR